MTSRLIQKSRTVAALFAALAIMLMSVAPAQASGRPQVQNQVDFILSEQLPSGAILSTGVKINPYFANIAALGLLAADTAPAREGVLAWMHWYLAHLNTAASNVPANSVFDYIYDPGTGVETPTGDFDSVDSYASTALNLAYAAYNSSDPVLQGFVESNITTYEAVADILNDSTTGVRVASGAAAGLTIAKPSYPIPYTMDNVEVYSGLAAFASLETALGRTAQAEHYADWAEVTRTAVIAKLWNPTNNNWDWAYLNGSDTDVFYAQGTAQLWPIIFGVIEPDDPRAVAGWDQFTDSFPRWFHGETPDAYPWTAIARAAQLMGEPGHARVHLVQIDRRYGPTYTLPTSCKASVCGEWYNAEAGWYLLASAQQSP